MKPGKRFGLSAAQKLEVWSRWKTGQTLHEIGRAFGKPHTSIRCLVSLHGGIVPAARRRKSLEGSRAVGRFVRKVNAWGRVLRPGAEELLVLVALLGIEPVKRTAKPGSRPCGPS